MRAGYAAEVKPTINPRPVGFLLSDLSHSGNLPRTIQDVGSVVLGQYNRIIETKSCFGDASQQYFV